MNATHESCLDQRVLNLPEQVAAPADQAQWYAIYTWARHEKTVARHLEQRGMDYFLPLYAAVHRWNNRSARVSLPLFPGYVFVQTTRRERHRPLSVPGVVQYVSAGANPSTIPDEEIEGLRQALVSGREVAPHPYLAPGRRVRISSGPLAGLRGTIERTKSGFRFIVSVDMIRRSVAIELDGYSIAVD
jgi:transcription antitermination factor NusG